MRAHSAAVENKGVYINGIDIHVRLDHQQNKNT